MAHLLVFALFPLTFASPTPASEMGFRLSKRENPAVVTDGYSSAKPGGEIFNKYFPDAAVNSVLGVFNNIIGKDTSPGSQNGDPRQKNEPCSSELSRITVVADFADDEGKLSCTEPETMGATRHGDLDDPVMILCKSGLAHGGINKGYDHNIGPSAVTCDTIGDRVTWKMDTLGAVILHEYTHFGNLVSPPLGQETGDTDPQGEDVYGPIATQDIASNEFAETVADNYAWFATEAFWSAECKKTYGKPQDGDDDDPNCDDHACKDKPNFV